MFYIAYMNDAQKMRKMFVQQFPNTQIEMFPATEEENATFSHPVNHPWFLMIYSGKKEITIEWSQERGFDARMFVDDKNHVHPRTSCIIRDVQKFLSFIGDLIGNP